MSFLIAKEAYSLPSAAWDSGAAIPAFLLLSPLLRESEIPPGCWSGWL